MELTAATPTRTHPAAHVDNDTPTLPIRDREWSARLRGDPRALAEMAHHAGGPYHVLHPATFAANVRSFQNAMLAAGVDGRVHYGKKANNASCWLTACAETGAGVDVASAPELAHSLACGVRGEEVVVTGPAKATDLLWLALRQDALITVDALDELHRLTALARSTSTGRPARVLLRVLPDRDPQSRFGFDAAALTEAIEHCARARDAIDVAGFSFHLSGYEVEPRAALAAELVERCVAARSHGLTASAISIGGGFAVNYADAADWQHFLARQDDRWYHAGRRPARFYPYHSDPSGSAMLTAILDSPAPRDGSVGEALVRAGVRLLVEPGRALLDGAGFSVFGVQGFKEPGGERTHGIVTVDGLSMSVSEQWKGSEFLPDPILWPEAAILDPVDACVGGASCLEYDMLTWRTVPFPRTPHHGDLLVYPNTAGYQMDKNETRFHQLPLPPRFVVETGDDGLSWRRESTAP